MLRYVYFQELKGEKIILVAEKKNTQEETNEETQMADLCSF